MKKKSRKVGVSETKIIRGTPHSMNSLFGELFREFLGVVLGACETISGGIWEVFERNIKANYPETNWKKSNDPLRYD